MAVDALVKKSDSEDEGKTRKMILEKSMVILDLDKTLLQDDHQIGAWTQRVLASYRKRGGKIVLATGRAIRRCEKYLKQVEACGLIALNGSVTYYQGKILAQVPIDEKKVGLLVQELLKIEGMSLSVAYPDHMLTNNPQFAQPGINDYCDMRSFDLREIQNIKAFSMKEKEMEAIDVDDYGCRRVSSLKEPGFHVILSKEADKFYGVKALCSALKIDLQDTIAFGDDLNDLGMIRQCGIGVAVANASEMIKAAADDITASNQEEGVGRWLDRYFELAVK